MAEFGESVGNDNTAEESAAGHYPAPTMPSEPYLTEPRPVYPPIQPAPAVPQPMRRPPVNYQPNEAGWWLAADGLWYPPETVPGGQQATVPPPAINNPQQGSQNIVVHVAAPQAPSYPAYVSGPPKSRVAAGLLGIFLGAFGAHRFYLGNSGLGVLMLLLSLLSLGILAPFVAVWGLIEGIVILAGGVRTDSRGIPLN